MKILWLLVSLLLASGTRGAPDYVQLGPVETLHNGTVTLQVALRVGRIVPYHRTGEPDWVVVRDEVPTPGWHWNPWGGDRLWPTAQALNVQIYKNTGFDPVIDGQPWELIAKTATSLEMRSGISPHLGLRVIHRIALVGQTTEVIHSYTLERLADSPFPVHAWTVTGVRAGEFFLMESDPRVRHDNYKPYKRWVEGYPTTPLQAALLPGTRNLQLSWPKEAKLKVGTYGRWIAMVSGRTAFLQHIGYDPDLPYLETSNLQAFVNTETSTYELETLSPTWFMQKGERREWTVRWSLLDFPAEATDAPSKASYLHGQIERAN